MPADVHDSTATTRLTFPGATGARLVANLTEPTGGQVSGCAVFAHCFTCSKDLKAAVRISRELARLGIAVLRFDFTGIGESAGDFADTNFSSNVEDLLAAARFLADVRQAPSLAVGHSLGGAAVLQAAGRLDAVRAVATIGAPYDPAHVAHLFAAAEPTIRAAGEAEVLLAGRRFRITRQFLDDLEAVRVDDRLAQLQRALLVMHSPVDTIVGIENAERLYRAAKHPKSFVSLDSADHLLTRDDDARYAARVLAAWASRYTAA